MSEASPREKLSRESQLAKLTQCEDDLSHVATNVTQLITELQGLRFDSEALGRELAERETALEQHRNALATQGDERARLEQQAGAASEALRAAESRLLESDAQVATFGRELEALHAGIDERERRLVDLNAQHELVRSRLAEREGQLELARAEAEAATFELAEARGPSSLDEPHASLGHVRLFALPGGYMLDESEDPCPRPGDVVSGGFGECVVTRIGPSPFPGDKRRCAVLSVAPT